MRGMVALDSFSDRCLWRVISVLIHGDRVFLIWSIARVTQNHHDDLVTPFVYNVH